MVICLAWGADLHMSQLMPLPLTISCSSKSRLVLLFWYRLTQVVTNKMPLNGCNSSSSSSSRSRSSSIFMDCKQCDAHCWCAIIWIFSVSSYFWSRKNLLVSVTIQPPEVAKMAMNLVASETFARWLHRQYAPIELPLVEAYFSTQSVVVNVCRMLFCLRRWMLLLVNGW